MTVDDRDMSDVERDQKNRLAAFRAWFRERHGRDPNDADVAKHWLEFEVSKQFPHDVDQDD
jgi:hypothetical protein